MSEQRDDFDLEVSALEPPAAQNASDAAVPSDSSSPHPATPPGRQSLMGLVAHERSASGARGGSSLSSPRSS